MDGAADAAIAIASTGASSDDYARQTASAAAKAIKYSQLRPETIMALAILKHKELKAEVTPAHELDTEAFMSLISELSHSSSTLVKEFKKHVSDKKSEISPELFELHIHTLASKLGHLPEVTPEVISHLNIKANESFKHIHKVREELGISLQDIDDKISGKKDYKLISLEISNATRHRDAVQYAYDTTSEREDKERLKAELDSASRELRFLQSQLDLRIYTDLNRAESAFNIYTEASKKLAEKRSSGEAVKNDPTKNITTKLGNIRSFIPNDPKSPYWRYYCALRYYQDHRDKTGSDANTNIMQTAMLKFFGDTEVEAVRHIRDSLLFSPGIFPVADQGPEIAFTNEAKFDGANCHLAAVTKLLVILGNEHFITEDEHGNFILNTKDFDERVYKIPTAKQNNLINPLQDAIKQFYGGDAFLSAYSGYNGDINRGIRRINSLGRRWLDGLISVSTASVPFLIATAGTQLTIAASGLPLGLGGLATAATPWVAGTLYTGALSALVGGLYTKRSLFPLMLSNQPRDVTGPESIQNKANSQSVSKQQSIGNDGNNKPDDTNKSTISKLKENAANFLRKHHLMNPKTNITERPIPKSGFIVNLWQLYLNGLRHYKTPLVSEDVVISPLRPCKPSGEPKSKTSVNIVNFLKKPVVTFFVVDSVIASVGLSAMAANSLSSLSLSGLAGTIASIPAIGTIIATTITAGVGFFAVKRDFTHGVKDKDNNYHWTGKSLAKSIVTGTAVAAAFTTPLGWLAGAGAIIATRALWISIPVAVASISLYLSPLKEPAAHLLQATKHGLEKGTPSLIVEAAKGKTLFNKMLKDDSVPVRPLTLDQLRQAEENLERGTQAIPSRDSVEPSISPNRIVPDSKLPPRERLDPFDSAPEPAPSRRKEYMKPLKPDAQVTPAVTNKYAKAVTNVPKKDIAALTTEPKKSFNPESFKKKEIAKPSSRSETVLAEKSSTSNPRQI